MPSGIVGYGADVTGGLDGRVFDDITTWAEFRAALETPGPRILILAGNADLDGNDADFDLRDSNDQGNLTIFGGGWTGQAFDYKILFRCSNVYIKEFAGRPGEGSSPAQSADRRGFSFNPEPGQIISGIVLRKCSYALGPDVVGSFLNGTMDVTVQECILGPALYESNIDSSPNGYGPNITDTAGSNLYTRRITYWRNFLPFNYQRNLRAFQTDGWDVINNAIYGWGGDSGHGNPRKANLRGNMFKEGPGSKNRRGWRSELGGSEVQSYWPNSVYFPTTGDDRNIGIERTGGGLFVPTATFASGTKRTSPYAGGLIPEPASVALFNAVVSNAGRTHQDALDTAIKAHALAGTESSAQANGNHWYNGANGPAPHP